MTNRPSSSAWSSPPSPRRSTAASWPGRVAREEAQRGALADFLDGWGVPGGSALT
ncbi:hypothetical protein [Streptomyces goshikiensis]|uniref:hypothetical protein n=1 Tax=Streptomyces goshikiensis TaxID=1942 RepID=UPI0036CF0739